MKTKLVILKTGQQVIAGIKELVSKTDSEEKCVAYLLYKPHIVTEQKRYTLMENAEEVESREVEVTLSNWILLSKDEEIMVQKESIITIVEPHDSLVNLYLEKTDGQNN